MSLKYTSVKSYWDEASKGLDDWLNNHRDLEAEGLIGLAIAIFAYTMEDVQKKVSINTRSAPKLLPLMVLGFDTLRGLMAAQQHLSLATAIICGRALWEAKVKLLFIKGSKDPDLYADRFARFSLVEKLKRHYAGRVSLSPPEVAAITAECKEWIDPKTGLLKKKPRPDWTAEGLSVRQQAEAVDDQRLYESYYSTGSIVVHAASIGQKLYMTGNQLQTIATGKAIRQQSAFAMVSAIALLTGYAEFFGIPQSFPELHSFHIQVQKLMEAS